ncbi:hypothetical protein E4T42_05538 [Aureobasidium subglaciale]|nr:hypothetical protein E4T42_05538 [Aureobasidium subglaciale]
MAAPTTPRSQAASQSGPSRIVTAVQTGLAYDIGALSPTSQDNAEEGLCNNRMTMIRCYERDEEYHFELQERVRVTVSQGQAPTCSTCEDQDGRACRHIWWVDDQILKTAVPRETRSQYKYRISKDGKAVRPDVSEKHMLFYDYLEGKDLDDLAEEGGWWKQDPFDQQDVKLVEQTASQILSAFEPCGALSTQHGQENLEMLQRESQALFARYRDEMIRQVKSQPFLLVALGAAVPMAERDLLHLTKIHSRIERIFFDYGYWLSYRKPNESNLDATAEALCGEIGHLRSFVLDPHHTGMAISLRGRIAGILLYTLEQMVEHAIDIQTCAAVPIPQYSGLSLQDRSLLHKLINPESVFAIDILRDLGPDVLHSEIVQNRVEGLADKLRDENTPEKYVGWLEKIVGLEE